ncbi:hypothetical protein SAMN04515674_10754 [Pseudarcicella hirudinis]|uniref:Uncharacterized protein n=2 Tax=Pseudarcicella hirudinis TaxID=1079859 RepID=A0A1I5U8V5_9BACT|nr:hypothetical protein SAMN04515674_10754 [Pseudarcicella hirudinis]
MKPTAENETERQLLDLFQNYKKDYGAGFVRSTSQLVTGLSACFTMMCLLGGLVLVYLLKKKVSAEIMEGILNIYLVVYGIYLIVTIVFTFLPPIIFIALVFLTLLIAKLKIAKRY